MSDYTSMLRDVARDLNTQFKTELASAGVDPNLSDVGDVRIPTSSYMLNLLLEGGVPLGRVMEIFGDESVGKSTIMQHMMIGFQRAGGISILLDAETGWHRGRAVAMGHQSSRHMHLQADTVELGGDTLKSTISRLRMPGRLPPNLPIGFFWDTVSSSQTEGEKEDNRYKDGISDKARKIRELLRVVAPLLPRVNASLVFLSQTITDIKAKTTARQGPVKKAASGGDAIKFWSAKRLKMWVAGRLNYPVNNSGIISVVKNVKDKLDSPNREIYVPIMHRTGIHRGHELCNYLIDNSAHVNLNGSWVDVPGYLSKSFYRKDLDTVLVTNDGLIEYLEMCADETWAEQMGTNGK